MIKLDQKNVAQVHNSRHVLLQFYKVPLTILAGICPTKLISHINLRLHREEVEGVRQSYLITCSLLYWVSLLKQNHRNQPKRNCCRAKDGKLYFTDVSYDRLVYHCGVAALGQDALTYRYTIIQSFAGSLVEIPSLIFHFQTGMRRIKDGVFC